jgi:hypothetical protein
MISELKQHKLSYSFLIIFLVISGFLFLAVWPDRRYQRYLILLMSTFYFLWGIVVHYKRDDLNMRVFFEYLGVSIFAGLLLFLVTI